MPLVCHHAAVGAKKKVTRARPAEQQAAVAQHPTAALGAAGELNDDLLEKEMQFRRDTATHKSHARYIAAQALRRAG